MTITFNFLILLLPGGTGADTVIQKYGVCVTNPPKDTVSKMKDIRVELTVLW